jgi:hypothetical protein
MAGKRVQLLKQLIAGVSRVAFLWNPNNGSHLAYLEECRAAAPILGVEALFVEARRASSRSHAVIGKPSLKISPRKKANEKPDGRFWLRVRFGS